jgi:hypothetical protein
MSRIRKPSPALIVSLVAVLLAVGGTAFGGGSSNGRIVAYAKVNADGGVAERKSLNIGDGNVLLHPTSLYCFKNLPFRFKGAQVTIDFGGVANGSREIAEFALGDPNGGACETSNVDAVVSTADANTGAFVPHPFFVQFYK